MSRPWGPARHPPRLPTLALLTALSALSLNMLLPSLPAMARDLGTRDAVAALAVSGYMIAAAVCQLALGPLSDRLGRRPVMLGALAVYTAASLGCLLATDAAWLLAGRLLQAVVVAGTVVGSAIVRDQYPGPQAAVKLGTIASTMALAPMLAPLLGGWVDTVLGWRAVFGLYTALGAAALGLAWLDLGETRQTHRSTPRLRDGLALLRSPRYGAHVLCLATSVGAFYIFVTGVPYVAAAVWGLSPAQVGLGLGSITGGYMVGAWCTTRLTPRWGLHRPIVLGRAIAVAGLALACGLFAAGATHALLLFGLTLSVGLGNGLTLSNTNAAALSVQPALAGSAAGFAGAFTMGLGALLSTLTAVVVERRPTPTALLVVMLGSVAVSLGAALVARRWDGAAAAHAPA